MDDHTEPTDTHGPRGTYGCACVAHDARNCILQRYGWRGNFAEPEGACECLCHNWRDDDDDMG